jgi:hypothetical protein
MVLLELEIIPIQETKQEETDQSTAAAGSTATHADEPTITRCRDQIAPAVLVDVDRVVCLGIPLLTAQLLVENVKAQQSMNSRLASANQKILNLLIDGPANRGSHRSLVHHQKMLNRYLHISLTFFHYSSRNYSPTIHCHVSLKCAGCETECIRKMKVLVTTRVPPCGVN